MNNEELKFDSQTGEPLNKENNLQNQNLNTIATIEQSNTEFINNVQNETNIKNEKTSKKDYTFIIIIFILILLIIIFLFPILKKFI